MIQGKIRGTIEYEDHITTFQEYIISQSSTIKYESDINGISSWDMI